MRIAFTLKSYVERAEKLQKDIDDLKYNHGLEDPVGKPLATALNEMTTVRAHLKEAAMQQAFQELEEEVG